MRIQTKTERCWKIFVGVVPALVLALSLGITGQAQATSFFAGARAQITWEPTTGITFGDFATATNESTDGTTGNSDSGTLVSAISEPGEISAERAEAAGQAFPPGGWALASADALATVVATNNTDTGRKVDFSFLLRTEAAAEADIPGPGIVEERASAFALAEWFVDDIIQDTETASVFVFNGGEGVEDAGDDGSRSVLIPANSSRIIGVRARAEGEAHVVTPEPASVLLMGSGLLGLGAWQWRRNKRNQNAA